MSKAKNTAIINAPPEWKQQFKASTIKVGFQLMLSRSMLEFLCAVADDVRWDRATFGDIHYPDNWIATEACLTKRGLVHRKQGAALEETAKNNHAACSGQNFDRSNFRNYCELTPAGLAVIELLKVTGLFMEQDTAINRKSRRA